MSRGRVLIIDDEEKICSSLGNLLEENGYEVDSCLDGLEGISMVQDGRFDVIFVDLVMPGIDGLAVLRRIKEIDEKSVVIIITGYPDGGSILEAVSRGAMDYITKPFNIGRLLTTLERAVDYRRSLIQGQEIPPSEKEENN